MTAPSIIMGVCIQREQPRLETLLAMPAQYMVDHHKNKQKAIAVWTIDPSDLSSQSVEWPFAISACSCYLLMVVSRGSS